MESEDTETTKKQSDMDLVLSSGHNAQRDRGMRAASRKAPEGDPEGDAQGDANGE